MAKFLSPPERLLRSAIAHDSNGKSILMTTKTASASSFRAAFCAELNKPLVVKNIYDSKPLGGNEIRIRVRVSGISFADILICQGAYQEKSELPFIPGGEVAGDVIEIGSQVTALKEGDKVLALTHGNGFAEQCTVEANQVWKLADGISCEAVIAAISSYGTAYMALEHRAKLKNGETLLVTAAAGATGLAAVDLGANVFGAKVIGAAGSSEKIALSKSKGALHVVNYRQQDLRKEVLAVTKRKGVDVVFDAVGGDAFKTCLRCIAFEGRLLTIGYASGSIPKIPANLLLVKNVSAVGLFWGSYRYRNLEVFNRSVKAVLQLLGEGKIHPHVGGSFSLNEINEAFQFIKDRKSTGKVIIKMV